MAKAKVEYKHTLAEVATRIGVSATTIKYYITQLPGLVDAVGEARQRRFSDSGLATLRKAREWANAGKPLSALCEKLGGKAVAPSAKKAVANTKPVAKAAAKTAAKAVPTTAGGATLDDIMAGIEKLAKAVNALSAKKAGEPKAIVPNGTSVAAGV